MVKKNLEKYRFEASVESVRNAFQDGWIRWLQKEGPASRVAQIYHDCMADLDNMRRMGMERLPALYHRSVETTDPTDSGAP